MNAEAGVIPGRIGVFLTLELEGIQRAGEYLGRHVLLDCGRPNDAIGCVVGGNSRHRKEVSAKLKRTG